MKLISAVLLAASFFVLPSCKKDTNSTEPTTTAVSFDPAKATLLKQGNFAGNMGYAVNGSAKLYEYQGKKYIYLENFSTSNGPDLKLYIATNAAAAQFVNLGKLQSNSGNQAYEISNPPDFAVHNKILIWCQQFSILFGQSTLQ